MTIVLNTDVRTTAINKMRYEVLFLHGISTQYFAAIYFSKF